jgi:hypothetical protein
MQVFAEVVGRRFDLIDNAWSSTVAISLSLTHMVNIILMLEILLSILLIFKDFRQNSFCLGGVRICVILNGHTTAMDRVKLPFHVHTSW